MKRATPLAIAAALALSLSPLDARQAPPSPPAGTSMLAGRVIDTDSGEAVPGATVTLNLARPGGAAAGIITARYPQVLTDSQGRFAFTSIPAGQFLSSVAREGYASTTLGRVIDVGEGAKVTDFTLRLSRLNTITGTIRDEAGDPVGGTEVLAFVRASTQGRSPVFVVRGRARTNDRGEYRLVNLFAGQYVICACTRDPIPFDGQLLSTLAARPLDLVSLARRAAVAGSGAVALDTTLRTYVPTFYPGSPLASRAERVIVAKGESKTADMTVATARANRVSGQVIGLPASSISASSLRLVPVGDIPEAAAITMLSPMLVQPDGRFDFAGVVPGTYVLEMNTIVGAGSGSPSGEALAFLGSRPGGLTSFEAAAVGPQAQDIRWASETVVVGDEDVTGLVIAAQPGMTVRGRFEISEPAVAAQMSRSSIQLMAMEERVGRPGTYRAQVAPDLTFTIVVPPGRYVFPLVNQRMTSFKLKGVEIFDAPLEVNEDISDLVLTVPSGTPPLLIGTAVLPPGETPDDWAVLVFPADRRLWQEPFAAHRRFFNARLSADRIITLRPAPGDYLLALNKGVPPDWIEAPTLEELAKVATPVTIVDGDKKTVQVKR